MLKYAGYAAFAAAFVIVALHFSGASSHETAQAVASLESAIASSTDRIVQRSHKQNVFLAAAAAHVSEPLALGARTKTARCRINGVLPDPDCTPGAVFPDATSATICVKGYTRTVRNVAVSAKRILYAEYGIAYPQPSGAYEADHLIPLELGGSNDISNLFPEAARPAPGFHEKDLVENYLHNEVCAGDVPLAYAQQAIAANWLTIWHALTPEEIALLKSQY